MKIFVNGKFLFRRFALKDCQELFGPAYIAYTQGAISSANYDGVSKDGI